ncbi:hypothetical protein KKH27_09655 [bacterium]|nr:hypothetical protein [bacterium]MBU1983756.1 hypothetical protein [bacterium]
MSKMMKWIVGGAAIVVTAIVVVIVAISPSNDTGDVAARFGVATARAAEPMGHIGTGPAAEAMEKAGNSGKYVLALFYREDDEQTAAARDMIEAARKKISRKSEAVEINVTDPTEKDVVNKFGVSRSPLPLVLMLAPNGAIMTGAPASRLDEDKLAEAVGTKSSEQVIKALQQKNMVALCMQNRKTKENADAMSGVKEFMKDPKFGPTTAVVTIDPSDPDEAKFLSKLSLDANSGIATTALLAPPGAVIGTFEGAVTMEKLVASVEAAAKPKSGGCCPPGSGKTCGPTGGTSAPRTSSVINPSQPIQPKVQISRTPPPSEATPATKENDPATKKQGK